MNFGKWIVVAFVFFALFIGTLVTVCVRQDVPLVSREYYKEELAYQDQIVRMENVNLLQKAPEVSATGNKLTVRYEQFAAIDAATIKLVRPSDASLDQQFQVQPSELTTHSFTIDNPVPGLYRVQMTWTQEGKEYFVEEVVVL
mgnify:CR=1 FL=1